jgi:hypothetical protein
MRSEAAAGALALWLAAAAQAPAAGADAERGAGASGAAAGDAAADAAPVAAGGRSSAGPASAIPWLSDSLRAPTGPGGPVRALPPPVETEAIGRTRRDAAGLLPASVTGLAPDAWSEADPAALIRKVGALPGGPLPAARDLATSILLAELDPPDAAEAAQGEALFLARVDALLRMGALAEGQALLERAGATDREAFRRWFDAALLTGDDTRACAALTANPGVSPRLPARIFCLTRGGDWMAAALTLDTGRALGLVSEEEEALLGHFLDPEIHEGLPPPVPPRPMTPLAFRLLDGIGEPPDTRDLPLAFAVADLRPTAGWKARLDAAERLARAGAMDANRLLALYTEGRASASGGVWERVAAVQKLDAALMGGEPGAVAAALPGAWARMQEAGLLVPLAEMLGARLAAVPAEGPAAALALRLGLLSRDPGAAARGRPRPDLPRDAFAWSIARGEALEPPPGALPAALAEGLAEPAGEDAAGAGTAAADALDAALVLAGGREADADDVARALAALRAAGLEDAARRAALQLLLL